MEALDTEIRPRAAGSRGLYRESLPGELDTTPPANTSCQPRRRQRHYGPVRQRAFSCPRASKGTYTRGGNLGGRFESWTAPLLSNLGGPLAPWSTHRPLSPVRHTRGADLSARKWRTGWMRKPMDDYWPNADAAPYGIANFSNVRAHPGQAPFPTLRYSPTVISPATLPQKGLCISEGGYCMGRWRCGLGNRQLLLRGDTPTG